jgi:hypothetical protein
MARSRCATQGGRDEFNASQAIHDAASRDGSRSGGLGFGGSNGGPPVRQFIQRLPRKWDGSLNRFMADDDWLFWRSNIPKIREKQRGNVAQKQLITTAGRNCNGFKS